jgi:hypothetical protein
LPHKLLSHSAKNKVDNELMFEQGKHNLEGSEETHDLKLQSNEELSRNTHEIGSTSTR